MKGSVQILTHQERQRKVWYRDFFFFFEGIVNFFSSYFLFFFLIIWYRD